MQKTVNIMMYVVVALAMSLPALAIELSPDAANVPLD